MTIKRLKVVDTERCVGCQNCMFACVRAFGEVGLAKSRIFVRSAGGMERGFVVIVCRACENPPCAAVCPTNALTPRKGGGVRLNLSKCIGCGNCKRACIIGCVFWDEASNKPMICIQCGYCANFCPHGVLSVERIEVPDDCGGDENSVKSVERVASSEGGESVESGEFVESGVGKAETETEAKEGVSVHA
ncbi:MAG: 4Fe-4S binding protein [Candidatus Methanospirare jalkutatii]|nr:4Fe-4S binding protein [Candidatus Methanospirare jalkutatii]